jgi:S-adenosylmethionine:tRNA ribosyltransferase-isomerase
MMNANSLSSIEFFLPSELEAGEPPEARGLRRDQVRLMVSSYSTDLVTHTRFYHFPRFLEAGDVLVVNTSRTRNSALLATRADGTVLELHLSTCFESGLWTVEVRSLDEAGKTTHFEDVHRGETLSLPGHVSAILQEPYISDCSDNSKPSKTLWLAKIKLPEDVDEYLLRYGFPIRYNYVRERWPLSFYQTVYATESGSAEMPSAGRPFTAKLLKRLEAKGVQIAPLILHTGVSNLETHEPPYKEFYRVPAETAQTVNDARSAGKRIVAVGTTVIRALETVTNGDGKTRSGEGWTCLVVTPQRRLRAVNALLTGMHEPDATHLAMLEALAGMSHLQMAYWEALRKGYLWHEFGDLHLILP